VPVTTRDTFKNLLESKLQQQQQQQPQQQQPVSEFAAIRFSIGDSVVLHVGHVTSIRPQSQQICNSNPPLFFFL
jgi:hypothetical protein